MQEGRSGDAASEANENDEEKEADKLCDGESLFEADLRAWNGVSSSSSGMAKLDSAPPA